MGRRPGPPVSVWSIDDRRTSGKPKPWVVRWKVGTKVKVRAFSHRAQAEQFRSRLMIALADGEAFDPVTGEPVSWGIEEMTVAAWTKTWFDEQRPTWTPRSRRSAAEVLSRALPILVADAAPDPAEDIAASVRQWLAGREECPAWLERWSLPLASVTNSVAALAHAELTTRMDGRPFAAVTVSRYRTVMRSLFASAVERSLIDQQPWPKAPRRRAATTVVRAVDVTILPTPTQAAAMLDRVISHQPGSRGHHAVLACVYYAGMRPSEARELAVEDLVLPDEGWGSAQVRSTVRDAGELWTDAGEETGAPKVGSVRRVPLPPVLVTILRDYIGDRTSGRIAETRNGNALSESNLGRAWRRAQGEKATLRPYEPPPHRSDHLVGCWRPHW
jgi:integrase